MKRFASLFFLLSVFVEAFAQIDTITHTIERGESLEYLAEKYGVAEADIKNCNGGDFDLFYTGMEVRIPLPRQNAVVAANTVSSTNQYNDSKSKQADELLERGDYKKAIKAYSEVIDDSSLSSSRTEAYYGRALAYYNRGKWKNAIKDFNAVLSSGDCTPNVRSHCSELLAKAQSYRQEQIQQRGEMWGEFFSLAVSTTATVLSAKQQNERAASSKGKSYGGTDSDYSSGSDTSETETTGSSGSVKSRKVCRTCKGDGKCIGCHGKKVRTDNHFGTGVDYGHECGVCGGEGTCSVCGGTGYQK